MVFAWFQIYGDGYIPKEMDFMVVEQHPTLLNVTLHTSKVGSPRAKKPRLKPWQPPWMTGTRDETISVRGASLNSSRNWRDGLRAYCSDAGSMSRSWHARTAVVVAVMLFSGHRKSPLFAIKTHYLV